MLKHCLSIFAVVISIGYCSQTDAENQHGLRDSQGRHMIPRGFVANTNDHAGSVDFSPNDYLRMVRLGANVQVIRLEMGRLSSFGESKFEPQYLARIVKATQLAREAGIKTIFKMTVYGASGFEWQALWANKNNEQQTYINAWKPVWDTFKNDEYVIGYDLVNEPRKLDMDISYNDLTREYLVPFYENLIDAALPYSDKKQFLIQTIFMNKGDAINRNQYAEINKKIAHSNIIFAPHIYQEDINYIAPTMERFQKESKLLNAPIVVGEWGFPTFVTTDKSSKAQLNYMEFYIHTAEVFDKMGIGAIKAWFLGNRSYQNFLPGGESTWAIFQDKQAVGTVERKYITDIIARPYPQTIAGDIHSFLFNFASRTLNLKITPDNEKGASSIFIGADRHYPDGFTVKVGEAFILIKKPTAQGFSIFSSRPNTSPSEFIWDEHKQRLVVLEWPQNGEEISITIQPGIYVVPDPLAKNN